MKWRCSECKQPCASSRVPTHKAPGGDEGEVCPGSYEEAEQVIDEED